jgi:hypothetical protein
LNKEIFTFLKEYNTDEYKIDRLLVSAFLDQHNIKEIKNIFIKDLLIEKNSDEYIVLKDFLTLLKGYDKFFHFESLLELFEFVISPSDKLINGAIYTPDNIRNFITKKAFSDINKSTYNDITVADIACGAGGFLIDVSMELKRRTNKSFKDIYRDNIFGLDIQKYSIKRTEILLTLFSIYHGEDEIEFEFNLYVANSLTFDWMKKDNKIKKHKGFDIIVGNPPYVCSRNMDEETKGLMNNWSVCQSGHPDLYIPFFQIGYELLTKDGVLGFITVSTFIKSLNGRAIRKYFEDNNILLKIIDFEDEQIFEGRTTYTCLCFLENIKSENIHYTVEKSLNLFKKKIDFKMIPYSKLSVQHGWSLKNTNIIRTIESTGTPLGNLYNTKSGIATLRNNIYIFKYIKENKKYYFLENDVIIEKEICKDIINSNHLANKDNIDSMVMKIIFPYTYIDNKPVLIEESILKSKYPNAYSYLESHKDSLLKRDNGKGKYLWYEYGRNQSMERSIYKLLFPQLANEGFYSNIKNEENLYINNGMYAISDNLEDLQILQKIFMSDIFWFYVKSVSKYYSSNYYSLGRNYIKNFGIYNFSIKDKKFLINTNDKKLINEFLLNKYNINGIIK